VILVLFCIILVWLSGFFSLQNREISRGNKILLCVD